MSFITFFKKSKTQGRKKTDAEKVNTSVPNKRFISEADAINLVFNLRPHLNMVAASSIVNQFKRYTASFDSTLPRLNFLKQIDSLSKDQEVLAKLFDVFASEYSRGAIGLKEFIVASALWLQPSQKEKFQIQFRIFDRTHDGVLCKKDRAIILQYGMPQQMRDIILSMTGNITMTQFEHHMRDIHIEKYVLGSLLYVFPFYATEQTAIELEAQEDHEILLSQGFAGGIAQLADAMRSVVHVSAVPDSEADLARASVPPCVDYFELPVATVVFDTTSDSHYPVALSLE